MASRKKTDRFNIEGSHAVDDCLVAAISFVGTHCYAPGLFELAKEVLNETFPLVNLGIDRARDRRSVEMPGDDNLEAPARSKSNRIYEFTI